MNALVEHFQEIGSLASLVHTYIMYYNNIVWY